MKLTDIRCRTAEKREKPYKIPDGTGLYLYVTRAGGKSWRYNFRLDGKFKTYTYGLYPEITLQEAREMHRRIHKMVSMGIDPHEHEKEEKAKKEAENTLTFEGIAREWLDKREAEVKPKTFADIKKRLEKDVFPIIGDTPIKKITPPVLFDMLKRIEMRGAYEMASRARQYCSQIFRYAVARGKAERDFTVDLADALAIRKVQHQPALEPHEIGEFIEALEKNEARLFHQTRLAVKMLMLTFVRPIELASAEWTEFDFKSNIWTIPARKTKMSKDHLVPLSSQTLEILKELKEMNGHRQYVFVGQQNPKQHMSRDTLSKAVRALGFQGRHTAHGFRAMALTTLLEELRISFHVADTQLGRGKRGALGAAYDRAKYWEERVPMMQGWGDYLEKLTAKGQVIEADFGKKAG